MRTIELTAADLSVEDGLKGSVDERRRVLGALLRPLRINLSRVRRELDSKRACPRARGASVREPPCVEEQAVASLGRSVARAHAAQSATTNALTLLMGALYPCLDGLVGTKGVSPFSTGGGLA